MKKILLAVLILAAGTLQAAEVIDVTVKGMVCSFCAQGLERKFKAEAAVESVEVALQKKNVRLNLKEGKDISDEQIKKIILDAGYNVDGIKRGK